MEIAGGEGDDGGRVQLERLVVAIDRQFAEHAHVGFVAVQAFDHRFAVSRMQRNRDAGISHAELGHDLQQVVGGIGHYAQGTGPERAGLGQQFQRLLFVVEQAAGDLQQPIAGFRRRHALLVAVEQQDVIFVLQFAHLVGNRGLGEAELLGCPRKPAMDGDVVEGAQLDVSHRAGSPIL